jgi:monovalent cation:H+ antiporter-2, CPA2 family
MPHDTGLILILAAGFGLAFLLGLLALRVGLPPLVGYLVAGILLGPLTPGFVADAGLASQLAEVGVILLMFGVGLHFSIEDLLAVRRNAVPGSLAHMLVGTALGALLARAWDWPWGSSLVFGITLSVASTVVLQRSLEERGILDTADGRLAIGWLIVEDLATVLVLVLLPPLAGVLGGGAAHAPDAAGLTREVGLTLLKVTAFVALMYFVGRRAVPWLLGRVARTGSRELFTLAVLAVALGIAVGAASWFGVSFALGAFFAGVVIAESDLSYQAAADALPLQDAFAVLFFVSVGMIFDPRVFLREPLQVLGVLLVIVAGKSVAAFLLMVALRAPVRTSLLVAAGMAQIGEFSFVLVGLSITLGLLPPEASNLVLAGALLSITLNSAVFGAVGPLAHWIQARPRLAARLERPQTTPEPAGVATALTGMANHVVLVGYGRVGRRIGDALEEAVVPFVVVERDHNAVEALWARGIRAVFGDAARPGILDHVHLDTARLLVIATPDPYHSRAVIEQARRIHPHIRISARTHSEAGQKLLEELGVERVFMGERELALSMAHDTLMRMGHTDDEADAMVDALRRATSVGMRAVSRVEAVERLRRS